MNNWIIDRGALILITGAGGFIGKRLVASLLDLGCTRIRCLMRPASGTACLFTDLGLDPSDKRIEIFRGNLLSVQDCVAMSEGVEVVYHLAAGRGEKSFAAAYLNSVVTTRNLINALNKEENVKRFVNVSSFTVYTNCGKSPRNLLDESCPVEKEPHLRGSAYCFAKVKQDEMVIKSCTAYKIPYVIVRPGVVYGAGNEQIHGRIGLGTFGIFLHMGGSNRIPLTYVDNCADAIALSGLVKDVDNEVFNVVDDDLPTSRQFLRLYKKNVKRFHSLYIPHALSYLLCFLWEKYAEWSEGQLPNAFNRKVWHTTWKKTEYSNVRIKKLLGWKQRISTKEGLKRYFDSCRKKVQNA